MWQRATRASVIILFTSIMELNIEKVIAGSTTIALTQGESFLIPPDFGGDERRGREERPG